MFETGVCLPDRPGLSTAVNITVPKPTRELFNFLGFPFSLAVELFCSWEENVRVRYLLSGPDDDNHRNLRDPARA